MYSRIQKKDRMVKKILRKKNEKKKEFLYFAPLYEWTHIVY